MTGKVLINGASGFVGGTLAETFAEEGWDGLGVSRKSTAALPDGWRNVSREATLNGSASAEPDVDVVIHLEVKQHVLNPSQDDLEEFQQVNVEGTRKWLEWCERNGVRRFVFFSTIKAISLEEQETGDRKQETRDNSAEGQRDGRAERQESGEEEGHRHRPKVDATKQTDATGDHWVRPADVELRAKSRLPGATAASTQHPVSTIQYPESSDLTGGRTESDPEDPGETPYGRSKWEAEQLVRQWAKADPERSALILRPTVVYGPGNTANIYAMVDGIARGRFCLTGTNENIKSVVSKKNLAAATVHLVKRMQAGCEVFYVTDRESVSVRDMAFMVADLLGKKSVPKMPAAAAQVLAKGGDIFTLLTGRDFPLTSTRLEALTETTHFSCEKLLATGFKHPQTMKEGLEEMVEWYRGNAKKLKR